MARCLVIDVFKGRVYEKECVELQDYYDALNAKPFDIVCRSLDGHFYDVFCDGEGLYRENVIPSAIGELRGSQTEVMLVGNIIFANHDGQGRTISLTDDDIKIIKSHIEYVMQKADDDSCYLQPIIVGLEYPVYDRTERG